MDYYRLRTLFNEMLTRTTQATRRVWEKIAPSGRMEPS